METARGEIIYLCYIYYADIRKLHTLLTDAFKSILNIRGVGGQGNAR